MSQLKIECARRQLGTALDLYLRDLDPVSVHCLANGGCEVIDFYAKKAGGEPYMSHVMKTYTKLKIEEVRKEQRKYWTAFKHATKGGKERRDDELLSMFTDEQNDTALFIGWFNYAQATRTMPIEAQIHQIWWMALHPEIVDPKNAIELTDAQRLFPGLPERSRAERKRMLNEAIDKWRADEKTMLDPHTDPRPLVLDWKVG